MTRHRLEPGTAEVITVDFALKRPRKLAESPSQPPDEKEEDIGPATLTLEIPTGPHIAMREVMKRCKLQSLTEVIVCALVRYDITTDLEDDGCRLGYYKDNKWHFL